MSETRVTIITPLSSHAESLTERLAAECDRALAPLARVKEMLGAIEARPAQTDAYRRFYSHLSAVADVAEWLEREAGTLDRPLR